jgi:hypothetical protein
MLTHYFSCSGGTNADSKRIGTRHGELMFSNLVGSVGDIVHSGASGA